MKLLLALSAGLMLSLFALGCDAVKPREPKQVTDPVMQGPKYGDTKLNTIEPREDAGK